jgi:hypothetical protein
VRSAPPRRILSLLHLIADQSAAEKAHRRADTGAVAPDVSR